MTAPAIPPAAWKIHCVHLHNFKSYGGHVTVGPFKDFTCIVGPNGAGKSNLMDALSFVVSTAGTSVLRGRRPADLVHRRAGAKGGCSVSIVLRQAESPAAAATAATAGRRGSGAAAAASGKNPAETTFTRSVDAHGAVSAAVNGKTVSEKDFAAALERHQIGARVGNFLVFQHQVEAVAQHKARQLTELLEQVSGSGELRRDYDAAKAALETANEALSAASVEKRGATVAVNQMRLAKKEAERFEEALKQHRECRRDLAMVELFGIETALEHQKAELAKFEQRLAELQRSADTEPLLRDMKKRYAELHKAYLEELRRSRAAADDMRTKHNTMDRITAALAHLRRKQDSHRTAIAALRKTETVRSAEVRRIEEQLRLQKAALAEFEKSCAEAAGGTLAARLTPAQLEEYRALRREADCATVTLRQQRETTMRQRASTAEAVKQCDKAADMQRQQRAEVEQAAQRTAAYSAELHTRLADQQAALADLRSQLTQAQAALVTAQQRARERDVELARVQEQLYEFRHLKDSDRQRSRLADALQSLRALFPIRGRLVDLCAIPNERHRNAVTVTLGRNLEAVVVDTSETALACVRYLKEQRLPPMTFLPLDALQTKPVDDRLRTLGGSCKPVLDVVQYEPALEPAVLFAVGQTLLCDTLAEAKRVAYGQAGGERHKVVTLDGTMLLKNGSVQGGLAAAQSRARKWDEKKYDDLRAVRDRLMAEAAAGGEAELARTRITIRDLESRIQFVAGRVAALEGEIKATAAKEAAVQADLKRLADVAAALETRRARYVAEMEGASAATLAEQTAAIEAAEERVLGDFKKRAKVPDLAELEAREGEQARAQAERRQELRVLLHRLETSLELEQKRSGAGAAVRDAEETERHLSAEVAKVEKDHTAYTAIVAKAQKHADAVKAAVAKARDELAAYETKIRDATRDGEAAMNRLAIARKGSTALQAACDTLRQRRLNVVRRCEMEEVELVFGNPAASQATPSSSSSSSSPSSAGATSGRGGKRKREGDVTRGGAARLTSSEVFSIADAAAGGQGGAGGGRKGASGGVVCLDFSGLSDQLVETASDPERAAAYKRETEALVEQLAAEMEALAPNLRAATRYGAAEDRLGGSAAVLEEAKERARKAHAEFTRVKQQRTERFMAVYERIAASVDQVYKQLTVGTRAHEVAGSAYLSLEDLDEPYLAGTTYHATPPLKRFMRMEMLSGGERTMAALALLFAIHAASPTPFFVLDEVDAALDVGNVEKLANYLRTHSQHCQFVVVSLKDQLYHMADMLVGVMKNKEEESSNIITMDLRDYPY